MDRIHGGLVAVIWTRAAAIRRDRLLVIVVVLGVWGLITHGTFAGSGDEPHYLMIAHSLAFDADLDLANNYRDADLIGGGSLQPEAHARTRGGRLLPVHDVGMPLLFAPVVRIVYTGAEGLGEALPPRVLRATRLNKGLLLRHALSLLMALITGLLARELFLVLRAAFPDGRHAFAWAALFGLSPPVVSHSFLFFTEIPTAFLTLLIFRRLTVDAVRTSRMAARIGMVAGLLLLVHARNIGIVAGLTLVAAFAARQNVLSLRSFVVFLCGVGAGAIARTAVTYLLWGTFVTTPHAAFGAAGSATDTLRDVFVRSTGLLFDREYGLLAYAPIYLLAFAGLALLGPHRRSLARDISIVAGCYLLPVLLPVTNAHGWTGGWSPAARFLVPLAPLLWIGVYQDAQRAAGIWKGVVIALVVVQVAIDAYVWQFPRTLWNDGDGTTALGLSAWLPTWSAPASPPAFAVAAIVTAALACLMWRASRAAPQVRRVQG